MGTSVNILNESKRDNLLQPFVDIYNQKTGDNATVSQMKQALLQKLVNEAYIRNLSLASNYYLAGAARYYFNGDLTLDRKVGLLTNEKDNFNTEICERLSALILILRNAYIDSVGTKFEQPEDFGDMPINKLLRKYGAAINKELGIESKKKEKEEEAPIDTDNHVGNGYTFDILYSYEDARKYNKFTEPGAWCITYGEQHYDHYIKSRNIHYVIFLKDGYQNVERKKGAGWSSRKPHDEYGNSMIALLQKNNNGDADYITSRWNHGVYSEGTSCEADHAYTKEEFFDIVGIGNEDLKRIQKIWLSNSGYNNGSGSNASEAKKKLNAERLNVLRQFKYAQIRMNGGDPDPFDGQKVRDSYPMTGIERFKNIRASYTQMYNDEKDGEKRSAIIDKYNDEVRKLLKNTVRACEVELDAGTFYYLMDKNKILFETIVKKDGYDTLDSHFTSSEGWITESYKYERAKCFNNIVVCHVVNGIMLYNTRYHEFVNIGGKTKFKYVPDGYRDNDAVFYEVKMSSRQMALVSITTNRPLVLPNGSSWFEVVKRNDGYSWYEFVTDCHLIPSSVNALELVYDTSSGEKYFYDMTTKKFIQVNRENFSDNISMTNIIKPNKYGFYVLSEYDSLGRRPKLHLYKSGEPFYIDEINCFDVIKCSFYNGLKMYLRSEGGKMVFIFDCDTMQKFEPPIPTVHMCEDTYHEENMRLFRLVDEDHYSVLFDTATDTWMENPITGKYIFEVYNIRYASRGGVILTLSQDRSKIFELLPESQKFVPMSVSENKVRINIGDIRQMVTECIRRMLK